MNGLAKTVTYRPYKNFTEEQFKEVIRSDCSCIDGGNLTSIQHVIEKARSIFSNEKIVSRGNNKPHMTSQLRKTYHEKISI